MPSFFQCSWRELDIVEYVEHEVIDRHRATRRTRILQAFFTVCTMKNRLDNRSGLWILNIQQRSSPGIILNGCTAAVAPYFRGYTALVVYLKYKRHEDHATSGWAPCNRTGSCQCQRRQKSRESGIEGGRVSIADRRATPSPEEDVQSRQKHGQSRLNQVLGYRSGASNRGARSCDIGSGSRCKILHGEALGEFDRQRPDQ